MGQKPGGMREESSYKKRGGEEYNVSQQDQRRISPNHRASRREMISVSTKHTERDEGRRERREGAAGLRHKRYMNTHTNCYNYIRRDTKPHEHKRG